MAYLIILAGWGVLGVVLHFTGVFARWRVARYTWILLGCICASQLIFYPYRLARLTDAVAQLWH